MKGVPKTEEHKRKIALAHIGKKASIETKEKLRQIKSRPEYIEKAIANLPRAVAGENNGMYGKKHSEETKLKQSLCKRGKYLGSKSPNWRGGRTPVNKLIRESFQYKAWRRAVFERDGYACVFGGTEHGNQLEADHIKPFASFVELRFEVSNGRTLCKGCHRNTDTWGKRLIKTK